MVWRHEREEFRAPISATQSGQIIGGTGICGTIETGGSRTFHSYYSRVQFANGIDVVEEHPRHLLTSLAELAAKIETQGLQLMCAGLAEDFYESGLSYNSGWGYLRGASEAVHIMDVLHSDPSEYGAYKLHPNVECSGDRSRIQ